MTKSKKQQFTEAEQAEIATIQQKSGISRKTAIKKMHAAAKLKTKVVKVRSSLAAPAVAPAPDFKSAANDKPEVATPAVATAKPTKAPKAPKQGVIALRLTPGQVSKNRSERLRLF